MAPKMAWMTAMVFNTLVVAELLADRFCFVFPDFDAGGWRGVLKAQIEERLMRLSIGVASRNRGIFGIVQYWNSPEFQ